MEIPDNPSKNYSDKLQNRLPVTSQHGQLIGFISKDILR